MIRCPHCGERTADGWRCCEVATWVKVADLQGQKDELRSAMERALSAMKLARETPFQMGDVLRDAEMIARAALANAAPKAREP